MKIVTKIIMPTLIVNQIRYDKQSEMQHFRRMHALCITMFTGEMKNKRVYNYMCMQLSNTYSLE